MNDISLSFQALAKKVGSSKLSLAAYGNLANVPYVEDL